MQDDHRRLEQLVRARHPCVRITTHEEGYALGVVRDAALSLRRDMQLWSVVAGVRDGLVAGGAAAKDTEHPAAAMLHLAARHAGGVNAMLDLASHLGDPRTLRCLREFIDTADGAGGCVVLIDHDESLPDVVRTHAVELELSLPGEQELVDIIKATLRGQNREKPVEIDLTRSDLDAIVRNLRGLTRRQAERVVIEAVASDRRFDSADLDIVVARKRQLIAGGGLLEFVEAPQDLDGIGGLNRLKQWLAQRERAMAEEAEGFGLSAPRGVLLLGVQGAGKSLCAKAVATAWRRPLLRMDPGALYDRYVGESERRLRDALRQAEMMAPIVLWIDEIEKAFASAASRSTDGGLSQRMFGALLTWMQEHRAPVFLVATANDIEALPPELLRKGRFDEIFFVDLPGHDARRAIHAIHLRKRGRDPAGFDLDRLAAASDGYSGAEIEQAIVSALHEAFAGKDAIDTEGVLAALEASPPLSTTMREKVASLRRWADGRCVPAD